MKYVTSLLAVLLLLATTLSAQPSDVDLSIRFFDKQMYEPGDPIRIKIMLRNDSGSTYRFRLAENRMFNIDFDVVTSTNTKIPNSQSLVRERTSHQQVFYREVSVGPGEEYSFIEDVTDYVELPGPGLYMVSARFFPSLYPSTGQSTDTALRSNRLTLSVQPSTDTAQAAEEAAARETQEILQQRPIPPDEVVDYTIRARQQGAWNRFFLYLDTESILRGSPERERRFLQLSEEEQQQAIEQFREQLKNRRIEENILVVPDSYQIVRTTYGQREGTVIVDMRFRYDTYVEIKRYTYDLERDDDIWMITNYNVRNLGTEALEESEENG